MNRFLKKKLRPKVEMKGLLSSATILKIFVITIIIDTFMLSTVLEIASKLQCKVGNDLLDDVDLYE